MFTKNDICIVVILSPL
jgi:hypothetical protein